MCYFIIVTIFNTGSSFLITARDYTPPDASKNWQKVGDVSQNLGRVGYLHDVKFAWDGIQWQ